MKTFSRLRGEHDREKEGKRLFAERDRRGRRGYDNSFFFAILITFFPEAFVSGVSSLLIGPLGSAAVTPPLKP